MTTETLHLKKAISLIPTVSVVFLVFKAVQGTEFIYYLFLASILITTIIFYRLSFANKSAVKAVSLIVLFASWAAMTSLWSFDPSDSLIRALFFLFISCCSFITGFAAYKNDGIPLGFLLPANVLIILISLYSLASGAPENAWTGGNERGFMGYFVHQNTLASLLLFTLPPVIAGIFRHGFSLKQFAAIVREKNFRTVSLYLLLGANVVVLYLSHSRTSILCVSVLIIVFALLITKEKRKIFSGIGAGAAVFIALYFLVPSVKSFTDHLLYKGYGNILGNRMILWEPSLSAAAEGGFTGIGYGVSHPEIFSAGRGSHYEGNVYVREKGNSVLALWEETGMTGVFLFVMPVAVVFAGLVKRRADLTRNGDGTYNNNSAIALIIASLFAFVLHAQFEAWWAGPGSTQLPLYFMILGGAVSHYSDNYRKQ